MQEWVQLQVFCALDRDGAMSLTVGGMSKEFRLYHGTAGEMSLPIVADDFELTACNEKRIRLRSQYGILKKSSTQHLIFQLRPRPSGGLWKNPVKPSLAPRSSRRAKSWVPFAKAMEP